MHPKAGVSAQTVHIPDMIAFAELLDRLAFTPSRNAKLTLVRDYFATQADPDRGWALAALTGELSFNAAKPAFIRKGGRAHGPGAVRLVLRLRRRPGRDRGAGLAGAAGRQPRAGAVRGGRGAADRAAAEVQRLIEGWLDALPTPTAAGRC